MIWLCLLILWVIAGYLYTETGAYDRHGGWSLLIIAPFMITCVVCVLVYDLITGNLGSEHDDAD